MVNINQTLPVRQAAKNRPTSSYHRGVPSCRPPRGAAAALPTPVQVQVNTYNPHNPEKKIATHPCTRFRCLLKKFSGPFTVLDGVIFLIFLKYIFKALVFWFHHWFAFFFFLDSRSPRSFWGFLFFWGGGGGALFYFFSSLTCLGFAFNHHRV